MNRHEQMFLNLSESLSQGRMDSFMGFILEMKPSAEIWKVYESVQSMGSKNPPR